MDKICTVSGCRRKHVARGYCHRHYQQWRRTGEPVPPQRPKTCAAPGCTRPHRSGGFCDTHYRQARTGHTPCPIRTYTPS